MMARALTLVVLLAAAGPAGAQVTGSISGPVSTPRPRAPESAAPQAPAPGAESQSTNPFFGSVPQGPPTPEPLSLSAKDAVDRALRTTSGCSSQKSRRRPRRRTLARARRSAAEPHGRVSRTPADDQPGGVRLSARSRPIVGPFNVFDARVFVSQPVLDFARSTSARAERHNVAGARITASRARAISSCTSPSTCISQASPPAAASTTARAQQETARGAVQAGAGSKRAASSPASTCCARKCSCRRSASALIAAAERIREGEAAARARHRPAARQASRSTDKLPTRRSPT